MSIEADPGRVRSGRVIWHTPMSLDGFIADAADDVAWMFDVDPGDSQTAGLIVDRLGALIVGRKTMDVEDRNRLGFYGGRFRGPFYVLTHDTNRPAPVVKGVEGVLVNLPINEAIALALETANGKDVGILGATVASQALEAGLIDDLVVHIAPVVLGDGVRLYRGARRDLTLAASRREGDFVTLELTPRNE